MQLWSVFTQHQSNSIGFPTQWKLSSMNKTLIFKEAHLFVLINQYGSLLWEGKEFSLQVLYCPFPAAIKKQSNPFVRPQNLMCMHMADQNMF